MSKSKRKSIVFDLDGGPQKKVPRIPRQGVKYSEIAVEDSESSDWISFMQPETFTLSFMLELLEKTNLPGLAGKTKSEIEKLFLLHITPKPQRQYKNTRLGRILSALQRKHSSQESPSWLKMVQNSSETASPSAKRSISSLIPTPPSTDRLKPPPESCIRADRKTIKLGSSAKQSISSSSHEEMQSKLSSSTSNEISPVVSKRPIKIISISDSPNKSKKLKTTDSVTTSSDEGDSSTPKKHSSVSWP